MKLKEGMIVNCRTRKKALEFLKECYKQGIYLASGCPIGDSIDDWYDFKQDTCYSLKSHYNNKKIIIRYASKNYYMHNGCKIIDFDDLFKTESKFKVGDKVRVKDDLVNGEIYDGLQYFNEMKNKDINIIREVDHDGDCKIDKNNFWYSKEMLEKVKEEKKMSKCKVYEMPDYVRDEVKKVIINNRTVVVILKSGHKGIATCSPEDKFVESVGYQIALMRAKINKSKQDLKEKKETLNRITENPELIYEFSIV